jgi:hypothetical protein
VRALLVLAVGVVGCGATRHAASVSPRSAEILAFASRAYSGTSSVGSAHDLLEDNASLISRFEDRLSPEARPSFTHDPLLDVAAAVVADTKAEEEMPLSWAFVQWTIWRAGFAGRSRWFRAAWSRAVAPRQEFNFDQFLTRFARDASKIRRWSADDKNRVDASLRAELHAKGFDDSSWASDTFHEIEEALWVAEHSPANRARLLRPGSFRLGVGFAGDGGVWRRIEYYVPRVALR